MKIIFMQKIIITIQCSRNVDALSYLSEMEDILHSQALDQLVGPHASTDKIPGTCTMDILEEDNS